MDMDKQEQVDTDEKPTAEDRAALREDTEMDSRDYVRRIEHWLRVARANSSAPLRRAAAFKRARICAQDLRGLLEELEER
jgi:hypothetical protein